tara:strand:- start:7019 stop:7228 length:210 start_codon:yes stop_codon:yes gene_type:complete
VQGPCGQVGAIVRKVAPSDGYLARGAGSLPCIVLYPLDDPSVGIVLQYQVPAIEVVVVGVAVREFRGDD